ncbi:MAG: type VI secretion system contractile sheath large subunit [Gammaproteobacteria bacterium]
MSRATISTGGIPFLDPDDDQPPRPRSGGLPCHVLVLADFSGRSHRGLDDAGSLLQRRIIEVTRDNLDEVFQRLHVTLDSAVAEKPIEFGEPDDLHPDFLYERVDLFSQFRALKRQLQNPASFADAAARIQSWAPPAPPKKSAAEYTAIEIPEAGTGAQTVLDDLLHSTHAQQEQAQSVQALIEQIVAPYVIPAADPRLPELLDTVDRAASHLMRKLLHSSAFQGIEASWRGLQWLMKRLDSDSDLRIFIADISLLEIARDNELHSDDLTALHQLLIEQRLSQGTVPFSLIVADYQLRDELDHCDALANLGSIAADLGATLLIGGHERIAGCRDLVKCTEPADWNLHKHDDDFVQLWEAIREQSYSTHIGVVAPRFLLRLPYGKRTRPIDNFGFEELPSLSPHEFYLWGNGAWVIAAILCVSYGQHGWQKPPGGLQRIADLPVHLVDKEGETVMTPCAEVLMTDSTAAGLLQAGLLVIRSINNQDAIVVPELRSLHPDQVPLAGRWFTGAS